VSIVHLVLAPLPSQPADPQDLARWLGAQEQARLAAIRSQQRRAQFVAGRWLLRTLLAQAHGGRPPDWALSAPDAGPPAVQGHAGIHLALSHSGGWVAAALAAVPVGVDIEAPARPRDLDGLAALCCDEAERALLLEEAPGQRETRFYEIWTAKEAWIKQHGEQLAPRRLAQIHLQRPQGLASPHVRTWSAQGWMLALACTEKAQLQWHCEIPQPAGPGWCVRDELRPA
jgi:4'-phosphopantetheinyl transferase